MDWVQYLNYFSVIMVSVGTIVSVYVFYTEPTIVSRLILGLYAVIWGIKLYHYSKYSYYGLVVGAPNDKPVPSAIIQLTGKKQGVQALVHSTITDRKGRFLFIVKPSKYSMIVAKEGFSPAEAEVDEQRISKTIKLQPENSQNLTQV